MARVIVVVSRTEPTRFAYAKHVFASDAVDVILDRRQDERRRDARPVADDRRRSDRRVRTDATHDFEKFGWSIARR